MRTATKTIIGLLIILASAYLPLAVVHAQPVNGGTGGGQVNGGTGGGQVNGGTGGGQVDGGTGGGSSPIGLQNPLNNINSLPELLTAILDAVIDIGTIILLMALVYVGFQFVAAQGNEEKIKSARSALMWTVIGGLVLLGSKVIQEVITATVGSLTA